MAKYAKVTLTQVFTKCFDSLVKASPIIQLLKKLALFGPCLIFDVKGLVKKFLEKV